MKIVVSAPSKIHLSGEHAVVYGKPAVLASISKRLYVSLERKAKSEKREEENEILVIKQKKGYLEYIIGLVEKKYKIEFKDFSLKINSGIPVGAGLGSSAALAVATIAALREYLKLPWDIKTINELAYEAEKFQHGLPSGGDNTIVSFGGLLWYRKEFEFLKTFWLLPFKVPKSFGSFVLINTGRVESTGELVKQVGQLPKARRERLNQQIEAVTKLMLQAIHDEKKADFLKAVKLNQKYLEQLGVVSEKTKELISEIEKLGGTAKISGAGGIKLGSGIVLAMHKSPKTILKLSKKYKFDAFQVILTDEGVRREQIIV